MKRFACLLLLALTTAARGDNKEWSWGDEGPSVPETSEDAFSPSRDPRVLEPNPAGALAVGQLDLEGALSPEDLPAPSTSSLPASTSSRPKRPRPSRASSTPSSPSSRPSVRPRSPSPSAAR